jgi:hypothetical protein
MTEQVLISADEGIGRIVLNRPEKRNALTHAMMTAILDALDGFSRDDAIRVVLLTARGSSFCSGVDLADMQAVREERGSFDYELLPQVFERLGSHRNPTVAMVQGAGEAVSSRCTATFERLAGGEVHHAARDSVGLPCPAAERLVDGLENGDADMLLTGD